MAPTSHIEIDLAAIANNVAVLRRTLEQAAKAPAICAVLKADGYGLGAVPIARCLQSLDVDMIAVYSTQEACEMLDANITLPVLILMPVHELPTTGPMEAALRSGRLHLTIHDHATLAAAQNLASTTPTPIPLHLEIDTAMARGGVSPAQADELLDIIRDSPRLRLAGIATHFASAHSDPAATDNQAGSLHTWLDRIRPELPPGVRIHQASTCATFRARAHHADMVRVGAAILGYAADLFTATDDVHHIDRARQLRPAVRWLSTIIHTRNIPAGATVGYAGAWRASRPTRVGLVPAGFADGYPLALSSDLLEAHAKPQARITLAATQHPLFSAPVIGRVSMDQITVDLTDVPTHLGIGTPIELYADRTNAPNHVPALAHLAGSNTYELLCRLHPRVPRRYITAHTRTSTRSTPGNIEHPDAVTRPVSPRPCEAPRPHATRSTPSTAPRSSRSGPQASSPSSAGSPH